MNIVLWILQILLGLLFLFAGVSKFFISADELAKNMPSMSMGFLYFIGVCEALGGIGLIVPWATGILPKLTTIAAVGLVIIMIGATIITAMGPMAVTAVFPAVIGVFCSFIAYRRGLSSAN
jgi:uncharacterized membrane protein YphA (DoxX/SURF4 family)